MGEIAAWATPLLILPGIGLLVASTAARYESVHAEIHVLLGEATPQAAECAQHVVRRARLFQSALLSLYCAAATLGGAGLVGAVAELVTESARAASWLLSISGVACLVFAAVQLIRESAVSLQVIESHAREAERRGAP